MAGELIPKETAFWLFALEVKGVQCGVEPSVGIVGFFFEIGVSFPVLARAIEVPALDTILAVVEVCRRQIFFGGDNGLDRALSHDFIEFSRLSAPLSKEHQSRSRMRMGGAQT